MSDDNPLVLRTPAEMRAWSEAARVRGQKIAFVPTMGALHDGHAALLHEARRHADLVVLSIFVNPIQFGPQEDLAKYPRDLARDLEIARTAGVEVAFVPDPAAMYTPGFQTYVQVRDLEQGLCGARRPAHFVGVATVVCKLFNIVRPYVAVFGEKDFQQLAVIRRMVIDLDMGIDIVGLPTVREGDGLALSSRNRYLNPIDRQRALVLSKGLRAAQALAAEGERNAAFLVAATQAIIVPGVDRLDYLELRDAETLQPVTEVKGQAVLLVAAFVGGTRLIDNVRLE